MYISNKITLNVLHKSLFSHYEKYKNGTITEEQYLLMIAPLDAKIDQLEWDSIKRYISEKKVLKP